MPYYLGMDGGGSRTVAWIANERERVMGRAEAGPSNPLKSGFIAAQHEILSAARLAARRAGIRLGEVDAVCLGVAGAGQSAARKRMLRWLRKAIPARAHLLTTDADIALTAAFGQGPGIVLIAGTGSIAYARDPEGRVERAGGWGNLFGDEGSGYDIGRKAIAAALRAEDGRSKPTVLGSLICHALGLSHIAEAVLNPPEPGQLAALFLVVLQAARRGDKIARLLIEFAGMNLGDLVVALIKRLGWKRKSFTAACAGGVLLNSKRIRMTVTQLVQAAAPQARVVTLRREPVEGALVRARELAACSFGVT